MYIFVIVVWEFRQPLRIIFASKIPLTNLIIHFGIEEMKSTNTGFLTVGILFDVVHSSVKRCLRNGNCYLTSTITRLTGREWSHEDESEKAVVTLLFFLFIRRHAFRTLRAISCSMCFRLVYRTRWRRSKKV